MHTWISIAYVGAGAGFAFVGSFLLLLTAIGLALFALATWPARVLMAFTKCSKRSARTDARRVVIIGLDGFDPAHYRRLAAKHQLPHLERLEREGAFRELFSTCPLSLPLRGRRLPPAQILENTEFLISSAAIHAT